MVRKVMPEILMKSGSWPGPSEEEPRKCSKVSLARPRPEIAFYSHLDTWEW